MFNKNNFFLEITKRKEDYGIRPVSKNMSDTDRKRIAILITEEYLKAGGSSYKAMFLEREIYDGLKHEKLTCDPISREIHSQELKHHDFNPLKITLSINEKETQSSFVDQILLILNQTTTKTRKTRRPYCRNQSSRPVRS